MIYVGNAPGKGRGVFAKKRFSKGELIERAQVVVVPHSEREYLDKTVLHNYYYKWGEKLEDAALSLGYGSLYNHSYDPNAVYVKKIEEFVIDFVALREIEEGEEITVNYNGRPDDKSPLWFEPV
ncbi:MAG: SET domain-containing protein [Oscillatoria princeps RMCB-10]|jgi:SET domain-containing protein|nr:SET domain-containing protein [Oscillatoria princeps RMCB-10]